jgi:hypothetical protein
MDLAARASLGERRHISVSLLTHDIGTPQELQFRLDSRGAIVRGFTKLAPRYLNS